MVRALLLIFLLIFLLVPSVALAGHWDTFDRAPRWELVHEPPRAVGKMAACFLLTVATLGAGTGLLLVESGSTRQAGMITLGAAGGAAAGCAIIAW